MLFTKQSNVICMSLLGGIFLSGCASTSRDTASRVIVSTQEQRMVLVKQGRPVASYPVSTSKFGLGDKPGSYATPIGKMRVAQKIGCRAPAGAVFKSRRPTGEVLPVNAPGRDPIVTRILWLEGLEPSTKNALRRNIYIHGTPEERMIGRPASYGCIRMKSKDVMDLYDRVGLGAEVVVTTKRIPAALRGFDQEYRRELAARQGAAPPAPAATPSSQVLLADAGEARGQDPLPNVDTGLEPTVQRSRLLFW